MMHKKIKDQIATLQEAIDSPTTPDEIKEISKAKIKSLKEQLEKKPPPQPSPTPDQPSVESHLETLQQFEKQETLKLKGADLKNYQQYRDEDESVMAIYTASRNSSRKTVQEAATFLKKEAGKKNSDEAALKKLLIRLNTLLKVDKESKPDCKSCKARAGKKAISTKKRNGKPTTYEECLAIFESLPKAQQEEVAQEMEKKLGRDATKEGQQASGNQEAPNKPRNKPAKPGSKKYTTRLVEDALKTIERVVKAKAKANPEKTYKALCQLNHESALIEDAGAFVLFKAFADKFKTFSSGLVHESFSETLIQRLNELQEDVEASKKKAELKENKK